MIDRHPTTIKVSQLFISVESTSDIIVILLDMGISNVGVAYLVKQYACHKCPCVLLDLHSYSINFLECSNHIVLLCTGVGLNITLCLILQ